MNYRLILTSLLLFIVCRFLPAQNPFIQILTTSDGLPSNNVWWIAQDKERFLWFATDNGVSRYDGSTFIQFGLKDGLCDNTIVWIRVDAFGRVWFNGLNRKHNLFSRGEFLDESEAPFLAKLAGYPFFFQDTDSIMYFYSPSSNKICIMDTDNSVSEFQLPSVTIKEDSLDFEGMNVRHLGKSTDGELLIWTRIGLFKIRDLSERPVQISNLDDSRTIYGYSDSTYYELVHYPDSDTTLYIKYYQLKQVDTVRFPENSFYDVGWIAEDESGLFWITRSEKGLFCIQNDKIIFHLDIKESYCIMKDLQGNIWAASRNGAYKINPLSLKCIHYDNSFFKDGKLLDLSAQESEGIWGINGKSAFFLKDNEIYRLDLSTPGLVMERIYTIKDNTIITGNEYFHKFRLTGISLDRSAKMVHFKEKTRLPVDGQLMINSTHTEFALRNLARREDIVTYSSTWQAIGSAHVDIRALTSFIFYDCKNNLVLNAPEFSFQNQVIHESKHEPYPELSCMDGLGIKDHLTINKKTDLFLTGQDSLYLVTNNKKYNLSSFFENSLNAKIMHFAYADQVLCFSTERNIYVCENPIKILDNNPVEFDLIDIDFVSIRDISFYNDSLYVASDEGLTIIPGSLVRGTCKRTPIPYFQHVTINGKEVELPVKAIRLKSNERVSFEFGCLDYSGTPKDISYMMEGIDEGWINGLSKNITYGALASGHYKFRVRTAYTGGSWSEPVDYAVIVTATLLQSPFFYVIITLLIASIAFLIIIWRKNQVMKRTEMEHQLITLEQKALQSMMNPHFIFNSLGSIQNYILQNKPDEAGLYLSQFARLIRQNIHGIHSAMIGLDEEIDRLKNYMDLERLRHENRFQYQFHIEDSIEEDAMYIPSMIIQPFVENSILHGISAMEKDGLINISFVMESEKTIKITIEDNGIGIEQSKAFRTNDRGHLHMSMEMTRKRMDILGKKFNVETALEISDANPGINNPGTRVIIILPVSFDQGQ